MTKIISQPPRRPQWWFKFLRNGSIVERDGVQWKAVRNMWALGDPFLTTWVEVGR